MAERSYVKVTHPWRATIGRSSPFPSAFYAALIGQTLRFGMPAARRGGRLLAALGRRGIPESSLGTVLRAAGSAWARSDPTADAYLHAARAAWPQLACDDGTLPPPDGLDILILRRAAASTVFLFAGAPSPALVCKVPLGDAAPIERETEALRVVASIGIAPHSFGAVSGLGHVQRGLTGRALHIEPITPATAARLSWTAQHEALARAFVRLARDTAVPGGATWWSDGVVQRALSHPAMTHETRMIVMTAAENLRKHPIGVLCHVDSSPQNLLFDGDRLTGMVDWEFGTPTGLPGRDILNAAVASIENGVALVRWDERTVIDSFVTAWLQSPFAAHAREAAEACAAAAGVPSELQHAAEVVFFARRVGHRMNAPAENLTSVGVALAGVEAVCTRLGRRIAQ